MISNGNAANNGRQQPTGTAPPDTSANVDPAEAKSYGCSLRELRTLMEFRGSEAQTELQNRYQNVTHLATLVNSHPEDVRYTLFILF